MKLKMSNCITLQYFNPIARSSKEAPFFEDPIIAFTCPHCGDTNRERLKEGFYYDQAEANLYKKYIEEMRRYFLDNTGGGLDIVAIYNSFISSNIMTKIEIELMTNPEHKGMK